MGAPRQRLAAHATREALHVEDQARHWPHHQVRVADLLQASRALHPEDPLVIGAAVKLEVAYEARMRQHRAARRAREALLVIISLGDSHHVLVGDGASATGADRLQKTGLRLHGNGRLCGTNGALFINDNPVCFVLLWNFLNDRARESKRRCRVQRLARFAYCKKKVIMHHASFNIVKTIIAFSVISV